MKVVIQRVKESSVEIDNKIKAEIGKGLLVLIGISQKDNKLDVEWLVNKVLNIRIFNDSDGIMNKSIIDIKGEILIISQFTLMALTKKGNRPSYIKSASHEIAIPLYNYFIELLESKIKKGVKAGIFGADMKVSLLNDGPVTIIIDSKNKE
jgi:D-tyrosyl-tRNA(Tyr) deacylase